MAATTIGNMTLEELKQLIHDLMEERRIERLSGDFDIGEAELGSNDEPETRSLEEILEAIERDRWTPPPGSPTPAEMIREDRDRP